ncbi:MAG: 2-oxo-4-hydroxy-4-carboxy-5-ureidoimidazoline decarboxylase [Polyangiales bacterium]
MTAPHTFLNEASEPAAVALLARCCGATRWVHGMVLRRPFASTDALLDAADDVWRALGTNDQLEAFTHHPRIGDDLAALRATFASTADLSGAEQSGVEGASDAVLEALRDANEAYFARFGYIFIVCATGKTAPEMLALLRARLGNPPAEEISIAAAEQAKITRLRLQKMAP